MSEPAVPATNAGEIHDIGYRHYDGPRLGAGDIQRSLFLETLRGTYGLGRAARSKIVPFALLAVISLPAAVIAIVTGYFGMAELPLNYTAYVFTLQVAVTIFVGAQSPAVMSRDLRFKVAPLYFSRPLSPQQYVQAKYAGMAVSLFILMATPLVLLLVGALLSELPVEDQVPDFLRALAGAAMYALVLAGIGLLVAAMTPRRGLGVAAVVGVLLVLSGMQVAVMAMSLEFGNATFQGYTALLSPYPLVDGIVSGLLGADSTTIAGGPPGTLGNVIFVAVAVMLVAGCYAGLVARYRKALS